MQYICPWNLIQNVEINYNSQWVTGTLGTTKIFLKDKCRWHSNFGIKIWNFISTKNYTWSCRYESTQLPDWISVTRLAAASSPTLSDGFPVVCNKWTPLLQNGYLYLPFLPTAFPPYTQPLSEYATILHVVIRFTQWGINIKHTAQTHMIQQPLPTAAWAGSRILSMCTFTDGGRWCCR